MVLSQGGLANRSGSVLEGIVKGALAPHGFNIVQNRDLSQLSEEEQGELLIQNYPYTTLYGSRGKTEFLLKSRKHNLVVRIECKWQQSAGSVDEKLPHLYLSAINAMPEDNIIILIDGDGFRDGAIAWLRNSVDNRLYIPEEKHNKNIMMMNATEFMTWANNTFR
jgi:hypothetical protein